LPKLFSKGHDMELTSVDVALEAAIAENYDEVVVLGIRADDGQIIIHTSMDYAPDVFFTLQMAAKLLLETRGPLND